MLEYKAETGTRFAEKDIVIYRQEPGGSPLHCSSQRRQWRSEPPRVPALLKRSAVVVWHHIPEDTLARRQGEY